MAKRATEEASPAGKGHNSFAAPQLRSIIERIERLEEEKKALTADIGEIYKEAKSFGFDTKIMREVVRLRKLDAAELQEREAILDLYKSALGMLNGTPLGEATLERVAREVKSPKREAAEA